MKTKIRQYNERDRSLFLAKEAMPKKQFGNGKKETFGERMARLRQEAGYSQRDLAQQLDVSQRVIAYYEAESGHPPTHLLPQLAKLLGVSADQLLGIKPVKAGRKVRDNRLWRRFTLVEKLPAKDRKQVLQFIDSLVEKERLKKASGA